MQYSQMKKHLKIQKTRNPEITGSIGEVYNGRFQVIYPDGAIGDYDRIHAGEWEKAK